jgi:aryl carrier-like protein
VAKQDFSSNDAVKVQWTSTTTVELAKQFSKSLGLTFQAIVQACFAQMLMQKQTRSDLLFGTIQAGRSFASGADQIIGPCMNTVPIRAQIAQGQTFTELAQAMHQNNVDMMPYVHTPLRRIQRLAAKGPLFDSLLVFQNVPESRSTFELWESVIDDSSVEFPLAVECEVGEKIQWTVAMHGGYLESADAFLTELDMLLASNIKDAASQVVQSSLFETSNSAKETADDKDGELDEVETKIASAVSKIAKVDAKELTADTSIFALGLDSISAVELSRLLRVQSISLSVGQILRNPTVREMRIAMNQKNGSLEKSVAKTVSFDKAVLGRLALQLNCSQNDIVKVLPCTATQAYFYSAWSKLKGGRFMSNFAFQMRDTDKEAVMQRWSSLVDRHGILRTAIAVVDKELWQVVLSTELSQKRAQSKCFVSTISEALRTHYASDDFEAPSLLRSPISLELVEAKDASVLLLSIHHVFYDAYSIALLLAALQSDSNDLIPYDDFSAAFGKPNQDAIDFWKGYLQDARPFYLTPQNASSSLETSSILSPKSEFETQLDYFSPCFDAGLLQQKAQELQVTPQSLLLAAVGRALGQQEGKTSVTVGLYAAGRGLNFDKIDRLLGPTVNVLPVRMELNNAALVNEVHKDLIAMNGPMQQTSVATMHSLAGFDQAGGLVDVTLNVLPRTTAADTKANVLEDYGRLPEDCVAMTRHKYTTSFDKHAQRFEDLDDHVKHCVQPAVDIEVEYSADGKSLSFGVFCAQTYYSSAQAAKLVQHIWDIALT